MAEPEKITRAQMKEAIRRSGYLMEQRIFPLLENNGYYVETNPVYPDPATGKSREYDFSAITAEKLYREDYDFLFTYIIGECVNNSQPIVFFKMESPIEFLFHQEIKCAGIPLYFADEKEEDSELSFTDYFNVEKFHHYCQGSFSTQYCSFRKKKGKNDEWMAWHEDEHHGVFSALVEATKFNVTEYFSNWEPPAEDEEEPVNLNLFYPLLIFSGDLYECSQTNGKLTLRSKEHVQFRKSVVTDGSTETYQIDVIVENYLQEFLKILEKEQSALKRRFGRKKRQVRQAIDNIVAKASQEKSKKKSFREILEF